VCVCVREREREIEREREMEREKVAQNSWLVSAASVTTLHT